MFDEVPLRKVFWKHLFCLHNYCSNAGCEYLTSTPTEYHQAACYSLQNKITMILFPSEVRLQVF